MLAKKGGQDSSKNPLNTDEKLVYSAVTTGIRLGRRVAILTKDQDIQEQFYKLIWFLDTHYRGLLLADAYAFNSRGFKTKPMPDSEAFKTVFKGSDDFLLQRNERTLRDILPQLSYKFVELSCLLLGNALTFMTFGAEQGMARVLDVKNQTGGLSTKLFEGKNCHVWLAPLPLHKELRNCAAIATDICMSLSSDSLLQIPKLDFMHSILSIERFANAKPIGDNGSEIWSEPSLFHM